MRLGRFSVQHKLTENYKSIIIKTSKKKPHNILETIEAMKTSMLEVFGRGRTDLELHKILIPKESLLLFDLSGSLLKAALSRFVLI